MERLAKRQLEMLCMDQKKLYMIFTVQENSRCFYIPHPSLAYCFLPFHLILLKKIIYKTITVLPETNIERYSSTFFNFSTLIYRIIDSIQHRKDWSANSIASLGGTVILNNYNGNKNE